MKILHIISGNDNGGGANHVLNICKSKFENYNNIIGCIGSGCFYDKLKHLNYDYVLFPNALNNNDIINYINDNNIDVADFHGAKAFAIHKFINGRLNCHTAATIHSDYRYDFMNNKMKKYLYTPLSYIGLKSFKSFVCVSQSIKTLLNDKGFKGSKYVINNGININEIEIKETRSEIRSQYNMSEQDIAFVNIARMHPVKNQKLLINSFKKLSSEFENVKLIIVGDGPLENQLRQQCGDLNLQNKVIFTGFKSNPYGILNACDISILTSISEGGAPPLTVLESGALKKPVICTKVGDVDLNFTENEMIIIENNADAVYSSMKKAMENLKENFLGNNLYSEVQKNFTLHRFCTDYYNFYHDLCK